MTERSRVRSAGYRLFGRWFDYVLHLRPAEWPVMAGHTGLGGLLAMSALDWRPSQWGPAVLGLLLWVVTLNGGTLAINSAVDRDENDVAYLRSPPPPPRHLLLFGLVLMLAGLCVALLSLPRLYNGLFAICVVMSIAYSIPPVRLKSVPFADWFVNLLGFGWLTPLAGWSATGAPLTPAPALLFAGFGVLFAGLYPLTQIYQLQDDMDRGDRTLATRLGIARSLAIALVMVLAAHVVFWAAGRALGFPSLGWKSAIILLSLSAWLAVLLPWCHGWRQRTPDDHQRGMYLSLAAWALTDVALAIAWLS